MKRARENSITNSGKLMPVIFCEREGDISQYEMKSMFAMSENGVCMCSVCPYKTEIKCNMIKHIGRHFTKENYKCSECNYWSSEKRCITVHEKLHGIVKDYKYNTRGKNFNAHRRRENYKNEKHPHFRLYFCKKCPAIFNSEDLLEKHIVDHALYNVCMGCGLCFKSSHDLLSHIGTHISTDRIVVQPVLPGDIFAFKISEENNEMSGSDTEQYQDTGSQRSIDAPPARKDTPLDYFMELYAFR